MIGNIWQTYPHIHLLLILRNPSIGFIIIFSGNILTLHNRECGYILSFYIDMTQKAENYEKTLSYYEGVNKTRGSLRPFFPGKCWGNKLQKMPCLDVSSGVQKLKATWAVQVKNLDIYCKSEVNVCFHQEPAKTNSLSVQFWLLETASIPQAILIRGNILHLICKQMLLLFFFFYDYSILTK